MKIPRRLRKEIHEETLVAIEGAVREAESRTSGEIVVHLVKTLLPLEKPRDRARRTFLELGVHRTRKRNGVLLFVVLKKRAFEIVADEGYREKVDPEIWEEIATATSKAIGEEGFEKGIRQGIGFLGELLAKHFPAEEGDVNELPDQVREGS